MMTATTARRRAIPVVMKRMLSILLSTGLLSRSAAWTSWPRLSAVLFSDPDKPDEVDADVRLSCNRSASFRRAAYSFRFRKTSLHPPCFAPGLAPEVTVAAATPGHPMRFSTRGQAPEVDEEGTCCCRENLTTSGEHPPEPEVAVSGTATPS